MRGEITEIIKQRWWAISRPAYERRHRPNAGALKGAAIGSTERAGAKAATAVNCTVPNESATLAVLVPFATHIVPACEQGLIVREDQGQRKRRSKPARSSG